MPRFGKRRPRPEPPQPPGPSALSSEQERQEFHAHSDPIPTPPIRTVFIDVATDQQLGFWDAPLWLPVGGLIEGGDDLWEIVSVRLRLPRASPDDSVRAVLYLYARKAEA